MQGFQPPDRQSAQPANELVPFAAGVVQIMSARQMDEEARRRADKAQAQPLIQSLAAHVRECWQEAKREKLPIESRMHRSMRQRRGEYDPEKLAAIRKQGGSEIFMMLTSVKCRAASSWLKDSMSGSGTSKPWSLSPTPIADLPQSAMQQVERAVLMEVQKFLDAGGYPPSQEMIENAKQLAAGRLKAEQVAAAKAAAAKMEKKIEDQLAEGGFHTALAQFLDDLVTFPAAVLKGPVIRNRKKLAWVDGEPVAEDKLTYEWERVDPFNIYPAPGAESISDGYLIERHDLYRSDLRAMIGVDGYDEDALRAVLEEYGRGGLTDWLNTTTDYSSSEESSRPSAGTSAATISALQFWGDVPASLLVEWGMDEESFDDLSMEYAAEVWLVGRWVIKAVLNPDPVSRRPYFKTSYEPIPGRFWGHGVPDLIRDTDAVCQASARALVNNMAIASGPQVWVNVDRLPAGENVTQLVPWKIHQGMSDPMGGNGPPVGFFQPNSLASELMAVYERFSNLADEYSGIPKYMTGGEGAPGAGRTASGLSMMINNAGKAIKQVLSNIDVYVTEPLLELLYYYNMRYADDPELKGDVCIVAKGAANIVAREAQQVRLNEFLGLTVGNQTVSQIVGPEGIAALLREGAKQLDMDTDKVVPSEEMVRANQLAQQHIQMMQEQAMQQQLAMQQGQPIENIQFQRGPEGELTGASVMPGQALPAPGNGQQLMNGAPTTDAFQPVAR